MLKVSPIFCGGLVPGCDNAFKDVYYCADVHVYNVTLYHEIILNHLIRRGLQRSSSMLAIFFLFIHQCL